MRRNNSGAVAEDEAQIDLTPMLDVVFIMLIFFIVTASFIKEAGIEVNRPEASTSQPKENVNILVAISANNEIWMDKRRIDVRAVRVLVDTIADCYGALGVVHGLWQNIPSEFDDYIASPKTNLYQSLHTAVIGPEGKPVEIQIRTRDMHYHSEMGVAAHWRYKEDSREDAEMERRVLWMRRWLELKDAKGAILLPTGGEGVG